MMTMNSDDIANEYVATNKILSIVETGYTRAELKGVIEKRIDEAAELSAEAVVIDHVLDMMERHETTAFIRDTLTRHANYLYDQMDDIDREVVCVPEPYDDWAESMYNRTAMRRLNPYREDDEAL